MIHYKWYKVFLRNCISYFYIPYWTSQPNKKCTCFKKHTPKFFFWVVTAISNICFPARPVVQFHDRYRFVMWMKTMWILISWLQKPADQDLHCFRNQDLHCKMLCTQCAYWDHYGIVFVKWPLYGMILLSLALGWDDSNEYLNIYLHGENINKLAFWSGYAQFSNSQRQVFLTDKLYEICSKECLVAIVVQEMSFLVQRSGKCSVVLS